MEKYHRCIGLPYKKYGYYKGVDDRFRLWARLELMNGSLVVDRDQNPNISFDQSFRFQYGLGIEYIMPLNSENWSLTMEPSIQRISATQDSISLTHRSIEIPIGVRYYLSSDNVDSNIELFLSGHYIIDLFPRTTVTDNESLELSSTNVDGNLAIGIGLVYKRIAAGIKARFPKDILGAYLATELGYGGVSLDISVRLF